MKFLSENPQNKYTKVIYNGLQILMNVQDISSETTQQVIDLCDTRHVNTNAGLKCKRLYYLRGARSQAQYDEVLIGFLEAEALPPKLNEIVHCLSFWNQEAQKMYAINKDEGETLQQFVLRCIAADCRAFVQPYPELFSTDRDEKQVWVAHHPAGERILLIHF